MKYIYFILCIFFALVSCNKTTIDPKEEDYKKLFPFKGIDKPESNYEDMNTQVCNPSEALNNYQYKGVEITDKRRYTVTIKCLYEEKTIILRLSFCYHPINTSSERYVSRLKTL